jgi:hypothetical protein
MTTAKQMREDRWYQREVTPHGLAELAHHLRVFYDVPDDNVGTRGNLIHYQGYHRSRAFVLHSPHCTDKTYSVSRTNGDHNGGDENFVSAIDIQVPRAELLAMCKRLDAAIRAGKLEKVTEWYGNLGGDERVDGYDNISNRLASSDKSHLEHLHMSIDRGHADDDHSDLFTVLTGGAIMGGFTAEQRDRYIASISERLYGIITGENPIAYRLDGEEEQRSEPNNLQIQLDRIEAKVDANVDVEAMGAYVARYLLASDFFVSNLAEKVGDRILASIEVAGIVEVKLRTSVEGH